MRRVPTSSPSAKPAAARRPALRRHPLAQAIAVAWLAVTPMLAAGPTAAQTAPAPVALPTGPSVAAGQASITTQGNQMLVRNAPGTILNWQSFSIGSAAGVHFEQAGATSRVLNRVTGNDPSAIFGSLTSNGQVWLLNPHGVLFGAGARVDVGGLVASTLGLPDSDFLAGRYRFSAAADGPGGTVRNEGTVRSAWGGQVVLLGDRVENTGTVQADGGSVTLAAARRAELVDTGLPNLRVQVDTPAGEVLNLGRVAAAGGTVDIYGGIVNQGGIVQADTVAQDAEGRIVLRASDTLTLGAGSVTQATGAGSGLRGGAIDLLGPQVALTGDARVDASGTAGGGGVRVGGGLSGQDTSVPNSRAVYFGRDARIVADATGEAGDGGRIILWSNEATRAYGTLSARGGTRLGAGGFVETSGGWLDARPASVDVSSRSGTAGQWLLDPNNIRIDSEFNNANISTGPIFTSTGDDSFVNTATLAAALNAGTSVTVQTGTGGANTQPGDITMNLSSLNVAPTAPVTLTLAAARDIVITNSSIASTGAALSLDLRAAGNGTTGLINLGNSTITTRGGNVTLGGTVITPIAGPFGTLATTRPALGYDAGAQPVSQVGTETMHGVRVFASTLNLGTGTFAATGATAAAPSGVGAFGVLVDGGTIVNAASIRLTGGTSGAAQEGVRLQGQATTLTATQSVTVEGRSTAIDGIRFGDGARLILDAAAGSGATMSIVGEGQDRGVVFTGNAFPVAANIPGRGTQLVVNNGSFAMSGRGVARWGIVIDNPVGRTPVGFDLADASAATFSAESNSTTTSAFFSRGVDMDLPVLGNTVFGSTAGLVQFTSGLLAFDGGSVTFRGAGVDLSNLSIGSETRPLAANFETLAGSARGVSLNGVTLSTAGGDVRFGQTQTLSSTVLGPASSAPWVTATTATGLAIIASSIDAGTGSITGGGASVSGSGVVVSGGSELIARNITLAGRSEGGAHGLQTANASLRATDTLSLEGLNAGGTSGLEVSVGSNVQVLAAAGTTGRLTVLGRNVGGGVGLQVEGSATANTRIVGTGVPMTLEGRSNGDFAALFGTGEMVQGDLLIDALGASALTLRGTATGGTVPALFVQNTRILGAQALAGAPTLLEGTGPATAPTSVFVLQSTVSAGGTLRLLGSHGVAVDNSVITGEAGLSVHSGSAGGAGAITVTSSTLATTAAGAALRLESAAGGAAVGQTADGITVDASIVNASGGGAVVLQGAGAAGAASGRGVFLTRGAGVLGGSIDITGQGTGAGFGVSLQDATGFSVLRTTTGTLRLAGTAGGTTAGVGIAGWLLDAPTRLEIASNNGLTLLGAGAAAAPRLVAGQALLIDLTAAQGLALAPGAALDSANLGAALAGMAGTATTTIRLAGTDPLAVSGALATPSRLVLQADRIDLLPGAQLASTATGDAIVLRGLSDPGVTALRNTGGANVLSAPNGRFVLLGRTSSSLQLGALEGAATPFSVGARLWTVDATGNFTTPVAGNVIGYTAAAEKVSAETSPAVQTTVVFTGALASVQLPVQMSTPTEGRVLDATPMLSPGAVAAGQAQASAGSVAAALAAASGDSGSPAFGALDWSRLPREDVQTLLAARARYKQGVFAQGVFRLRQDPALADVPACSSEGEIDTGRCLLTEDLKQKIQGERLQRERADRERVELAQRAQQQAQAPAGASARAGRAGQRRVLQAELPRIARKLALVIGVNDYQDKRVPQLGGAVPDARAVHALLEGRLGYESTVLENPTREAMVRAFNRLAVEAQADDSVIVYYAGHGVVVPINDVDTGFWLPADVDAESPSTWLANADIARLVSAIGSKQLMLVSDSCYSGSLAGRERVQLSGATDADELLNRRAAIVMSSGGDEPVADEGKNGHSVFAWHFMQALQGLERWQVGNNLFERVRAAVTRDFPQTPQYSANRTAGHQGNTDFLFERRRLEQAGAPVPAPAPAPAARP